MNENLDIFIYSHVPFKPLVENPVYKVLTNSHEPDECFWRYPTNVVTTGSTYNFKNLPVYRDYTGDNISDKNLMYNEYAGFYWILHNWDIKDYVGMFHYRRYYNFFDEVPDISAIFSYGFKIIINKRFPLQYGGVSKTNREFYRIWHNVDDFDLMGKIVKENYPQYADGWDRMSEATYIFPSSLFIMTKDMFKEYLEFAFDVMNKFNDERNCHTPEEYMSYVEAHHDEYVRPQHKYYTVKMQSRIIGYLVERCLCAFLLSGSDPIINHAVEYEWSVLPEMAWKRQPQLSASTKNKN